MAITVKGLAALAPGKWLSEPGNRNAGALRAKGGPGGVRFYFRYRDSAGRYDDLPIGVFDEKGRDGLSLAKAKERAGRLSLRYQAGERDLRAILKAEEEAAKRERRAAEAAATAAQARANATLKKLMAAYVEHLKNQGKPSWREVERSIERNLTEPFPKIAAIPADAVAVDDVMPAFHRLARAGKLREAEKLRAYLRATYTAARRARHDASMHAFSGFRIAANPLADLEVTRPKEAAEKAAQAAKERKWALTEDQLRAYWKRITALPDEDGAPLRFHLLTGGQRVVQLARLTKADHDVDRKTVTLRDTKGRRRVAHDHVVPLIPDAEKALEAMRGDKGDYLFTVTEGFESAGYHNLWERVRPVAEAMVEAKEIERVFSPGIIRKTVATRLSALKVPEIERNRLQSNGLGSIQSRHYDAHEYNDEKRAALEKLHVLLDPPKEKVVQFPKSAKQSRGRAT